VAEHLNSKECNIINSVAEAMTYVKAVGHPNFQCLVDSFHFWQENEAMEDLRAAMPWIKHVHLSDRGTRAAPGEGGTSDYRELFRVLKEGRYEGRLSVEAIGFKVAENGAKVLEFLKRQWNSAGEAEPSGVRT
jgi:sugar phosphate isomerase/epimerase